MAFDSSDFYSPYNITSIILSHLIDNERMLQRTEIEVERIGTKREPKAVQCKLYVYTFRKK